MSMPSGTVRISSVSALATLTGFADGAIVTTSAPRAMVLRYSAAYQNQNNGAGVDNLRTFAGAAAGSAWVRDVDLGMAGATDFAAWYVDSAAGDDNADGLTALTPVQHVEEVLYRLGKQPLSGLIGGTVAINLTGDFSLAGETLTIAPHLVYDGNLAFIGTKAVLATYTITTTPWNEAAGTIGSYALSGAPDLTALGYVGKFIRISSGPRTGWKATIAKDLTGGVFRGNFCDQGNAVAVEPVTGDTVQVYDVTKLHVAVRICPSGAVPDQSGGAIEFQDLLVGAVGSSHAVTVSGGNAAFVACEINGLDVLEATAYVNLTACRTRDFRSYGFAARSGCTALTNGGINLGARGGGVVQILARELVEGGSVEVGHATEGPGTLIAQATLALADYGGVGNADGLTVYPGGTAKFLSYLFARDGTGSGTTFRVYSGGGGFYTSGKVPAQVGTAPTNYCTIGGTAVTSVTAAMVNPLPLINASNGAMFVLYA